MAIITVVERTGYLVGIDNQLMVVMAVCTAPIKVLESRIDV
jgi:hypothetical protein